jgi:hypothetical protein
MYLSKPILPVCQPDLRDAADAVSSSGAFQNPLEWWALHKSSYPVLSQVARLLMAVPATSVSSERLFSKAGAVISDRRSKLLPKHAEQLCFLSQNWMD